VALIANLFQRDERPLGRKVIRNVVFSGVRLLLVAPVPFLLVPFVLTRVGPNTYGTWSVFVAIIALASLTDLGLTGTVSKHVSEYYAQGDLESLEHLLNSSVALYGLLASGLVVGLAAASGPLMQLLFRDSVVSVRELRPLFGLVLLLGAVNVLTLPFKSVMIGLQRLDLTTVLATLNVLLAAALTVAMLTLGWLLPGLVVANFATAVAMLFAHVWAVRRLVPQVRINPLRAEGREMRSILTFSLQVFVTQAAVTVHNQIEKVYLALLVGVVPTAWYGIASEVGEKVKAIPSVILAPVMPAASELDAWGDADKLRVLHDRTHKYLAVVSMPVVLSAIAFSSRFVELWIGPQYRPVATPLAALVTAGYINLITGPGYFIFMGQGILRPGVYSAVAGIVTNVLLSLALVYLFGFPGAIIGTCIALLTGATVFLIMFHRRTGFPAAALARAFYLKPLIAGGAIVTGLALLWPAANVGWGGLLAHVAVFFAAYGVALILSKHFDTADLTIVETLFPGLRIPRRWVRPT